MNKHLKKFLLASVASSALLTGGMTYSNDAEAAPPVDMSVPWAQEAGYQRGVHSAALSYDARLKQAETDRVQMHARCTSQFVRNAGHTADHISTNRSYGDNVGVITSILGGVSSSFDAAACKQQADANYEAHIESAHSRFYRAIDIMDTRYARQYHREGRANQQNQVTSQRSNNQQQSAKPEIIDFSKNPQAKLCEQRALAYLKAGQDLPQNDSCRAILKNNGPNM